MESNSDMVWWLWYCYHESPKGSCMYGRITRPNHFDWTERMETEPVCWPVSHRRYWSIQYSGWTRNPLTSVPYILTHTHTIILLPGIPKKIKCKHIHHPHFPGFLLEWTFTLTHTHTHSLPRRSTGLGQHNWLPSSFSPGNSPSL